MNSSAIRPPRRTLNRLAQAVVALAIGGLAQTAFRQESIWDGLLLFVVAVILFVRAVGQVPQPKSQSATWPPYRGLFANLSIRGGIWAWLGGSALFAAFIASLLGQWYFGETNTVRQAWDYYLSSLLLLSIGLFFLNKSAFNRKARLQQQDAGWTVQFSLMPYHLALVGILGLALILRLWNFESLPFGLWFDEAAAGLEARRWLKAIDHKPPFFEPINVSGHFLWLYAIALRFISNSIYGLRIVSVLFGVGGVWVAYLFGSTIRGPIFGLIMAFFLAVMRWDINFSRIAMTGIDTPFFELLSLYFLARLARTGRLRDALLSGITIGFGLTFYTGFRLFGLALGIFLISSLFIWRHWWGRYRDWDWWRKQAVRASLILFATLIVFMPVAQYAQRNPDSFSDRIRVTSIFNKRDDPNLMRALQTSLGKHAAMFHINGDKNGRHNLPGEPMLDPAMGILFIFGLGLALSNLFSKAAKPANLFFLLLVPTSLIGGIFSLDFEAPQSLRSIAILPAIAYFCTLPIIGLADEAKRVMVPSSPQLLWWPAGLIALYIGGFNAHTYFVRQAQDFAVWNAYSTAETISARKMVELGAGYDFYLSPFLMNHPAVRFITSDEHRRFALSLPDALPIRTDSRRPAAIFIHPDEKWVFEEAQRLYPAANFEIRSNAPENPPSVFIAELSTDDLSALQGLALRYWAGSEIRSDQVPAKAERVEQIDIDWRAAVPLTPPYIAEWDSIFYVPQYGLYELQLEAPSEATLEIDGVAVMRGAGKMQTSWELARGNHTLRLEAHSGDGIVRLSWQPPTGLQEVIPAYAFYRAPVANNGLLGKYFTNPDWVGSPAFMQLDPFLDTYFHLPPLPRPYSVEWTGMLEAPTTGVYGLGLRSVGEAQLFVDETLLIHTTIPDQIFESAAALQAGLHPVKILFQDTEPRSRIHFLWRPPGLLELEPLPGLRLWPSLESVRQPDLQLAQTSLNFEAQPLQLSHRYTLQSDLQQPRDIAVDQQGYIYVVDTGAKGIRVFSENQLVGQWTDTPDGPFQEPLAIVVDSNDTIWVLDSTRQWIYHFDRSGNPLGKIGGPEAQFYHPRGLTFFSQPEAGGGLAVANTGSGNIRFFDLDGNALGSLGFLGDAPGQFNEPVDLLRDPFGTFYVTEGANINRWQRVDPFGKPLSSWPLDAPVAFDGSHLAWGPDNAIFMTHSAQSVVRRYSPTGALLEEWHTIDEVRLVRPVGIFIDQLRNWLFVSDVATGLVHIFEITVITTPE